MAMMIKITKNLHDFFTSKKIQYLAAKIHFYEARVNLFTDFKDEHTSEIETKFEIKINNYLAKNKHLLLNKKFNYEVLEKEFSKISEIEIAKYRMKMRKRFRFKREQLTRKINRLKRRNALDKVLEVYEQKIVFYEDFCNDKINEYKDKRFSKLNQLLSKKQNQQNNAENLERFEDELLKKNNEFLRRLTLKKEQKLEKLNKLCDRKKQKYESKLKPLRLQFEKLRENNLVENIILHEDVILKVENLCMFFGGVKAVNDLSFSVKRGEIFGLIGPNGAGKTTVFNCITQFNKPTSGQIHYRDRLGEVIDLNKVAIHDIITHGIARTFQNLETVREVTVLENLLIAAHRQYQSSYFEHMIRLPIVQVEEKVIRRRADKILEFMGLTFYRDWLAWGLPYGVLKKLEIARTLISNPQLIILDEPAAGLNDTETKDLAQLIRKIRDEYNCSIFLVEHDMSLVMDVCDTILAISFGKKLAIGTAKEIQKNKDVQTAYLGVSEDE